MLLIQSHRDTCNYYCWQQLFYVRMYLYICGVRWCGDSDRWWEHQRWGCLVTIVQCYGGHLCVHHRCVYLVRGYVYGDHRRCAVDVVLSLQDLNQTFYRDMLNNNNIYQLLVLDSLELLVMTIVNWLQRVVHAHTIWSAAIVILRLLWDATWFWWIYNSRYPISEIIITWTKERRKLLWNCNM